MKVKPDDQSAHIGQIILDPQLMAQIFQEDIYIAQLVVAGRKPYDLHDLAHVSWVRPVVSTYTHPVRHITTASIGSTVDDLDRDLFDVWKSYGLGILRI